MQIKQKPVRFVIDISAAELVALAHCVRTNLHDNGDTYNYGLTRILESLEKFEEDAATNM
jgi:hypothetical protein